MTNMKLVFLGTGGSWPSPERNVTSVALHYGSEVLLFDCGEGTQRQLMRSSVSFMAIKKIFITHFHGDHFLGLPGLIQSMSLNDRKDELRVYGPQGTERLLTTLMSLGYFTPTYPVVATEVGDGDELEFQGFRVKVMGADHNVPTLAYRFDENQRQGRFNKERALELGVPEGPLFARLQRGEPVEVDGRTVEPSEVVGPRRPGRSLVFSGDTKPSEVVEDLSRGADVLVHEGTLSAEMGERAHEFGHSTARDAAELARRAGVGRLYIFHISPRYKEAGALEEEARAIFEDSHVPEDLDEYEVPYRD